MEHAEVLERVFGNTFTRSKRNRRETQHLYITKLQRRQQVPLNNRRLLDASTKGCNTYKSSSREGNTKLRM